MRKHIDAEVFFKLINTTLPYGELDYPDKAVYNAAISDMCSMLTHFPPADVQEVRHGRWEEHIINNIYCEGGVAIRLTCPVCGECFTVTREARPRERFCRWCGAKMDLEENDG